jgi:hypothetical protein
MHGMNNITILMLMWSLICLCHLAVRVSEDSCWKDHELFLSVSFNDTEFLALYSVDGRWMSKHVALVEWYWEGKPKYPDHELLIQKKCEGLNHNWCTVWCRQILQARNISAKHLPYGNTFLNSVQFLFQIPYKIFLSAEVTRQEFYTNPTL